MNVSKDQQKLFNRNKKFFDKTIPELNAVYNKKLPSNVQLYDQDGVLDLLINGERFYGEDAYVYAGQHIELFIQSPSTTELGLPYPDEVRTPAHAVMFDSIQKDLTVGGLSFHSEPIRVGVATAYLFGIGLGLQIIPYIQHTKCRSLVIVEPEQFFFVTSMYFVDWKKVFELLDRRVVFVFDDNVEYAFNSLRLFVGAHNMGLQQMIYYTQHYKAPSLDAHYKYFKNNINNLFDGLGFYDDEKTMTRNHLLNAYKDDWKLSNNIERPLGETAVIVGAGPSLDNDIDWLYRNRDKLVIFSGGSSLPTLLSHNIVPDFHVEIENVAMNYELLGPLVDKYDLSSVVLICSSTMDARSARLFNRRLWFMREGVFASHYFDPGIETFSWQNPTVVNTATAAAFACGFRNLLLLGADFGTRDPEVHHSKGSFYETHEELKKAKFMFPERVGANFGGFAYTNEHYLNGIKYLGVLFKQYRAALVANGSNGVAIKSTIPVKSERYKIISEPSRKSDIVDYIYRSVASYSWSDAYGGKMFDDLESDYISYIKELRFAIKKRGKKEDDLIIYMMNSFQRMSSVSEKSKMFNPVISGTIVTYTLFLMYWWRRVYDKDFKEYGALMRKNFRKMVDFLEKDFREFLHEVRQELPLVRPELFEDKGARESEKV